MKNDLLARAETIVNASPEKVWAALVTPAAIKKYMFGAHVVSEWKPGSTIVWKGDWQGKKYEDKGTILKADAPRTLQYTHFSPLTGQPDKPENYHTVTVELTPAGGRTRVVLAQDGNADEKAREHSEKNWRAMLDGLKRVVEGD